MRPGRLATTTAISGVGVRPLRRVPAGALRDAPRVSGRELVEALRACPSGVGAFTPMPEESGRNTTEFPPSRVFCPFCGEPLADVHGTAPSD